MGRRKKKKTLNIAILDETEILKHNNETDFYEFKEIKPKKVKSKNKKSENHANPKKPVFVNMVKALSFSQNNIESVSNTIFTESTESNNRNRSEPIKTTKQDKYLFNHNFLNYNYHKINRYIPVEDLYLDYESSESEFEDDYLDY